MNHQNESFCDQLQNQINSLINGIENSKENSKSSGDSFVNTSSSHNNIAGSGLSEQEIYYLILGLRSESRTSIDDYIEKGRLLKKFIDDNNKQLL